ncbi:hypothetical protein H6F56_21835 [Microcoleus sp. FACHB-672]|nr:hypothetical protein [Microcoleus sp. FACHB-672]
MLVEFFNPTLRLEVDVGLERWEVSISGLEFIVKSRQHLGIYKRFLAGKRLTNRGSITKVNILLRLSSSEAR